MSTTKDNVLEPYARHIGAATLFINADGSWSVGPNAKSLVPVAYGSVKQIGDDTFGFSAMAVESDGKGGYRLFVRSDADSNLIVEVGVSAQGQLDPASVKALAPTELYAVENQFQFDLNGNGGYGAEPVLLEGGAASLYVSALGAYQLAQGTGAPKTMLVGGQAVTEGLLPAGWDLVEVQPAGAGYSAYLQGADGLVYAADFDANANFTGGRVLTASELSALENSQGLDLDDDGDLPIPTDWSGVIKDPAIRSLLEGALASGPVKTMSLAQATTVPTTGAISHTELVTMLQTIIKTHKDAGNTPITADEVSSLQAMAARGKAAFSDTAANSSDYLAYVFSKMVNGSEANRFYTAGNATAAELGSLTGGSTLATFEKLVDKWILGGDMPNPATAGDTANPAAKAANPVYAKSTGSVFVDGVTLADVNQGSTGNCYLLAGLAGVAGSTPTVIQAMVVENPAIDGARSWGVRFYDAKGQAHWVTVNDLLPARPDDNTKLAYGGQADKSINGEIWVPLLEKAYAQANMLGILPRSENIGKNSFLAVEGGGGDPLVQLQPGKATQYSVVTDPTKAGAAKISGNDFVTSQAVLNTDTAGMANMANVLKTALNGGKTVWIGVTDTIKDSFGNNLLVGSHAHYALDADKASADNETVLVYNPWGLKELPTPPGPVDAQGGTPFVSPIAYTLTQLMGISGLDFVVYEPS